MLRPFRSREPAGEEAVTTAGRSRGSRAACVAIAALLSACAPSAPPSSPGPASTPAESPAAPEPLECTTLGYPCSLADVPVAILEHSNELGDEAATRVRAGSTMPEAAAWLGGQPDIAEVEADDDALRFRLTGGRSVWVLGERVLPDRAPSRASTGVSPASRIATSLGPRRGPMLASVTGGVVAQHTALVLSPMLWDFGDSDDGAPVTEILQQTRGYESGVTYRSNVAQSSTDVGIDDFRGWRDFHVIHVSSHGTRLCKQLPCRAVIIATLFTGALADLPERGQPGVEIVKSVKTHRTFLGLSADFFRKEYRGGLEETLVFFNACETYGAGSPADRATDLGDAIRGSTSVFLGWSESVDSESATLASVAFFQGLSQRGLTIGDAYDGIGELNVDQHPEGKHAQLGVSERQAGGDLRIRDVVSLRLPGSGAMLAGGESIPIEGKVGDGQPDAVPYRVEVEGMDAAAAAAAIVHVSAGTREAPPALVASGTPGSPGSWSLEGSIALDHDVVAPEPVELRAWLELPEGGTSEHRSSATLVGTSPLGGAWRGTATYVSKLSNDGLVTVRAAAELTFTLVPGQVEGARYVRYEQTAGMLTWQTVGTNSDGCAHVSPTVNVPITPEMASTTELVFDTSTSPIEYQVTSHVTKGPEVEVTQNCPTRTSTYTTRANATLILAFGSEHRTVVGDEIAGETTLGQATMSWQLTKVE